MTLFQEKKAPAATVPGPVPLDPARGSMRNDTLVVSTHLTRTQFRPIQPRKGPSWKQDKLVLY